MIDLGFFITRNVIKFARVAGRFVLMFALLGL